MLFPCPRCRRHVRHDSAACPFCSAALAIALATGLVAVDGQAHEDPNYAIQPEYGAPPPPEFPRSNAIQADLGLGVVGLAYERVLAPRVAVAVSAHVFGTWWGPYFDLPRFSGFGGQLRPTFFLTHNAPRGVYIAPFFRAESVSAKDVPGRALGWSLGTFVGYSFMLGERLNLRLGAGAQYMSYAVGSAEWRRFHPALDLVVGYTF